jgi:error-prone DNA polymerase
VEIRRKLQRSELIAFFKKQEACIVVLEACGAAHHWARMLTGLGHDVKLIAPEAVRPFVKKGKKNDAADAAALCAAASRPDVKFVATKSLEQQGMLALHSARSLLVKQQTMLANAMRSLATEFGLTVPKGISKLGELMEFVDADATFPKRALQAIRGMLDHCGALAESLETFDAEIVAHARHDETARRLATIPGIGPITASLIAATVRYRCVQKCKALRRLARSSAATAFHRREDPAWSDHQSGQPGDTHVAGPRSHVDGLPRSTLE